MGFGVTTDRVAKSRNTIRKVFVHSLRVLLVIAVLVMIRQSGSSWVALDPDADAQRLLTPIRKALPQAVQLATKSDAEGIVEVLDPSGKSLGYAVQTSPQSDFIIGYSGPTNCLIVLDSQHSIRGVTVLASGDTVEHVDMIEDDARFLESFTDFHFAADQDWQDVDVVSGATLTSYAIVASVAHRLGGESPRLVFQAEPNLSKVKLLFAQASSIQPDGDEQWQVLNSQREVIGRVLLTTPVADRMTGYQGPTATIIGLGPDRTCVGLVVNETYDNEPYASYLNDDYSFLDFYFGKTLEALSEMDPEVCGIDGVSGATMTSKVVAESIPIAAQRILKARDATEAPGVDAWRNRSLLSYWMDAVTLGLVLLGIAFSFTKLSQQKRFRLGYQILLIGFMGFYGGHMLSLALIDGWSRFGIPWHVAPGMVCLAAAAFMVPVFSKHQTYCQHLCPLGAIQQLSRKRLPWQFRLPKWLSRCLSLVPVGLLAFAVAVGIQGLDWNLASLEAFDGFAFRAAGWASITILIVGIVLSFVSPMAYCRFGCPTGTVLGYLKFRGDSHRLGMKDLLAASLAIAGYWLL